MIVRIKTAVVAATISMLMIMPAFAASTKDEVLELKAEVQALKESVDSMKSDLTSIKKMLEAGARVAPKTPTPAPFEPKEVVITGASVMGQADAKVTLIEYSDYQCPFCARHSKKTMPEIIRNYVNDGKVKFVMREFPIANLHPRAGAASEAALCARDQGKYWEMHDILFNNQRKMSDEDLNGYASTIGLDTSAFTSCMEQKKYAEQVQKEIEEGKRMGVSGTPSFVLGLTDPNDSDKVRVTKFVRGARPYSSFSQAIDELLTGDEANEAGAKSNP